MNTRRLFVAACAAALAAGLLACSGTTPSSTTPGAGASTTPSAAPSGGSTTTAPMAVTVTIKDFKFSPENVTVKKGGTVTWTNQDVPRHDAKPSAGGFTQTKLLAQGESSDPMTMTTAGAFDYICSVHPTMKGKVTVVE
jgi:plastocyanin